MSDENLVSVYSCEDPLKKSIQYLGKLTVFFSVKQHRNFEWMTESYFIMVLYVDGFCSFIKVNCFQRIERVEYGITECSYDIMLWYQV